jgi:hypothetical protein
MDMQLALVAAIAFFILMLHFNTVKVSKTQDSDAYKQGLHGLHGLHGLDGLQAGSLTGSVAAPLDAPLDHVNDDMLPQPSINADTITVPPVPVEPLPRIEQGPSEARVMHNMYEFPEVKCKAPVEATDAYMNEGVEQYYLDAKIKPYEDFISQLTNEELLESVSNGAFLQ